MNKLTGKISPHFTWGEVLFSQTALRKGISNEPSPFAAANLTRLCYEILEPARLHFGKPMTINSGYRSPALNAAVGGSDTSNHCAGMAIDVEIKGVPNAVLARWFTENIKSFDEVIAERVSKTDPSAGWVHVAHRGPLGNRGKVLTWWGPGKGYSKGIAI